MVSSINEKFIILDFEILITLLRLRSAIKMKIMISVRIILLVIVCLKSQPPINIAAGIIDGVF